MMKQIELQNRFWSKVEPPVGIGECWKWQACKVRGYGHFVPVNGKQVPAHRFAYEQVIGKIPYGLIMDHLCRNRSCINPYHLEPVTYRENIRRGNNLVAKLINKTHCIYGHPLSGDNLRHIKTRVGHRDCRECHRLEMIVYNKKHSRGKR